MTVAAKDIYSNRLRCRRLRVRFGLCEYTKRLSLLLRGRRGLITDSATWLMGAAGTCDKTRTGNPQTTTVDNRCSHGNVEAILLNMRNLQLRSGRYGERLFGINRTRSGNRRCLCG